MDQLAKDAAEARKAGMSYGQWKAKQEEALGPVKIRRTEGQRVCRHCGRPLTEKQKKWCSRECCNEADKLRRKAQRRE